MSIRDYMTPSIINEADVSPGWCLAKMTMVFIVDRLSITDELSAVDDSFAFELVKLIVLCFKFDL